MNDLYRWMPRVAKSAAIERASGIRRYLNIKNRQNRVLSPFCDQQKISGIGEDASSRFSLIFRRGLLRNVPGLLPLAPHPPPYKTGFLGWRENLAASFSGYFSTINYFLNHECKLFTRYFSSEFFSRKFCNCASH